MRKTRPHIAGWLLASTLFSSGCSLCCSPYLDDYSAFGSRTPRMDMKHGRVGSIFSDPSVTGGQPIVDQPVLLESPGMEHFPLEPALNDGLQVGPM